MKINIKVFIYSIIIILSLFFNVNNGNKKIFTLFNEKIVILTRDGIHFYSSKMDEEEKKKVIFDNSIEIDQEKIEITQFSEKDELFIMILVINILYCFNKDGILINYAYLSDSINNFNYTLLPYKKENNYLHYIITYPSKNQISFIINYFKFDINYPNSNKLISSKNIEIEIIKDKNSQNVSSECSKINCIFIFSLKKQKNILVCFYVISYLSTIEIQTKSFDSNNNFNEIYEYFRNYEIKDNNFKFPNFISGITNKDKEKILIYLINGYPYIMTFDLTNYSFSEPIKVIDINTFKSGYSHHKLFYLTKNNEILIISSINYNYCKIYAILLNSNFDIKYKYVIDQDIKCHNLNLFSSFLNGTIYTIDKNNSYFIKILNKNIRKLDNNPEKCLTSSEESLIFHLCLECNNVKNYYKAQSPTNDEIFVECYNNETVPSNFFLDETDINNKIYKPCYETCESCERFGDENNHNCKACAIRHIPSPKNPTDCVALCTYFYYYTFYGQYKCTQGTNCPEDNPLYIFEKKKCTDDCRNELEYTFQYGGRCYNQCPSWTINMDGICKDDENDNKCRLSENIMEIQGQSLVETLDVVAKTFAHEFGYTDKHITSYSNNEFSIVLYKLYDCIEELKINITKIEFGDCLNKVKETKELETIIIALVQRKNDKGNKKSIFYFYTPEGERINIEEICKDDTILLKENVLDKLINTDMNYNSMIYLTDQNIDIFNLSDEFYTDICFHFESPNGKDVPLKDRILSFYPNISLCDDDCISKGVNLTSMESICECSLNRILNNDLISGNAFLENTFGDVADFIEKSNLDILKCYEDVFKKEFIAKNIGAMIILFILFLQIIFGILFFVISMNKIKQYLFNLSDFFSSLIDIRNKKNKKNENSENSENNENNENKEKNENKRKSEIKYLDMNSAPPKNDNRPKIKKKIKLIKETENIKKSNKLDDEYNNTNLNSQKSFVYLYKDNFKFRKKVLKIKDDSYNRKDKLNKKEKYDIDIDIFKIKEETCMKEDIMKGIKKMEEKYGVNEKEYLKTDCDDMEFDDALKYDSRTFWEYFYEKFKENQIIMNTFFNPDNLKPLTIKIMLLLLNIDLYFVVNGFFYSENYISELFHSDKEEKFFSYFTRSISRFFYTTIVGVIISTIMDCIFVEEKKVKRLFIREKENHKQLKHEISLIIRSIKINYIIFLVICYIISIFSWYYVSCFNNVYPKVKIEWIKSSITIMIIMQILSFLAGFLVALIRLISFKCKSEKLYKLKNFFN